MRLTFTDFLLAFVWCHLNGAALAFAIIDDSHGRPYPDRPLMVAGFAVMVFANLRLYRRNRSFA